MPCPNNRPLTFKSIRHWDITGRCMNEASAAIRRDASGWGNSVRILRTNCDQLRTFFSCSAIFFCWVSLVASACWACAWARAASSLSEATHVHSDKHSRKGTWNNLQISMYSRWGFGFGLGRGLGDGTSQSKLNKSHILQYKMVHTIVPVTVPLVVRLWI